MCSSVLVAIRPLLDVGLWRRLSPPGSRPPCDSTSGIPLSSDGSIPRQRSCYLSIHDMCVYRFPAPHQTSGLPRYTASPTCQALHGYHVESGAHQCCRDRVWRVSGGPRPIRYDRVCSTTAATNGLPVRNSGRQSPGLPSDWRDRGARRDATAPWIGVSRLRAHRATRRLHDLLDVRL